MKRSAWLRAWLVWTLVALPCAGVSQRVLSMATLAPNGTLIHRAMETVGRELRRRSNGALSLRWYASGVQGDEAEVVRKIRSGRLDGGAMTATGLLHIHRPVLAFQLPGMFESPEAFLRAYRALQPDLEAGFQRAGFALVQLSPSPGPRMFSVRPIRTPADLRAAHPWQWPDDPILPAMYAEVGATGVRASFAEVLMALQTQRIDTVFAPPVAAIALQWSAHVHHVSERAASGSLGALVISRPTWEGLPEAQRALFREVLDQVRTAFRPAMLRAESEADRTMVTRGISVTTLTDAERQEWRSLFARVRTRLGGTISEPGWIARVEAAAQGQGSRP